MAILHHVCQYVVEHNQEMTTSIIHHESEEPNAKFGGGQRSSVGNFRATYSKSHITLRAYRHVIATSSKMDMSI